MLNTYTFLERTERTTPSPELEAIANEIATVNHNDWDRLLSFRGMMYREFTKPTEEEFQLNNYRKRTAGEIWASRRTVGCPDSGVLVAAASREMGIPTMYHETVQRDWAENPGEVSYLGHVFLSVRIGEDWHIIDPWRGRLDNFIYGDRKKPTQYVPIASGLDYTHLHLLREDSFDPEVTQFLSQEAIVKAFLESHAGALRS